MPENEFEFDLESFDKEYEESLEPETDTEVVEDEPKDDVETEEVPPTDETEETEKETPEFKDDRQNKAFAELRRQAEENKKFADFVSSLAEEAGVKPEEVLQRFQDRKLEQESEAQGVPVEVLQRINALETENTTIKEQKLAESLDTQIKSVMDKYNLKEEDDSLKEAFAEMLRNGVDPRQTEVNFEKFYRAANFDKLVQMEIEKTRQTDLEAKKKRQEEAAIPNGTSTTQTDSSLDQATKDAKDILANW